MFKLIKIVKSRYTSGNRAAQGRASGESPAARVVLHMGWWRRAMAWPALLLKVSQGNNQTILRYLCNTYKYKMFLVTSDSSTQHPSLATELTLLIVENESRKKVLKVRCFKDRLSNGLRLAT